MATATAASYRLIYPITRSGGFYYQPTLSEPASVSAAAPTFVTVSSPGQLSTRAQIFDNETVSSAAAPAVTGISSSTSNATGGGAAGASAACSINAGPHETGLVAAAIAAAGFLGVVAAL